MTKSVIGNQRGIQQHRITAQSGSPAKKEKIGDLTPPRVAGPHTFIKYLQDYYESLDSLFINPASGEEKSRTN